jgi:hypothetical protein
VTRETIPDWFLSLERAEREEQLVMLCYVAGHDLDVDTAEANGALRRASLLLVSGGDPRRRLELSGRAVSSVASDLDTPQRRQQLAAGLAALEAETLALDGAAETLDGAAEALGVLRADEELAWRCFAAALLAEELGSEG